VALVKMQKLATSTVRTMRNSSLSRKVKNKGGPLAQKNGWRLDVFKNTTKTEEGHLLHFYNQAFRALLTADADPLFVIGGEKHAIVGHFIIRIHRHGDIVRAHLHINIYIPP